jgi:NTE family protein
MGVDYVIGIDLNARHDHSEPENIIEVLLRSFDFALDSATKEREQQAADVVIKPNLYAFNMVDVRQVEDLMKTGYAETMKVLKALV